MTSYLSEQLTATGFAKVIVSVEPVQVADTASVDGPQDPTAVLRAVADDHGKQRHFIVPKFGQDASLARLTQVTTRGRGSAGAGSVVPVAAAAAPPPRVLVFEHLGLLLGTVDSAGLAALRADSRVKEIVGTPELRLIRPVAARSARPARPVTWGIDALGIPEVWSDPDKLSGEGVLIGHLDTGVDGTHPALAGAIAEFAEFDAMGQRVPGAAAAHDTGQHGTHTAGTLVARPVNNIAFGCAPGARLASGIVIDGVTGLSSAARILGGLDWLLSLGIRVLSMSVGLSGFQPDFQLVIRTLRAKNVLPVCAIGNDGPGTSYSPGNYDDVISVGAMDRSGVIPGFSSSQTFLRPEDPLVPDLVAPGVDIISSIPGGGTVSMQGTSMATPHVAALAALLLQADGTATAEDIEAAIFGSCTLGPKMPMDRANRGLPNAPKALALLRNRGARVAA